MLPEMEEFANNGDISLVTLPTQGLLKESVAVCVPN